MTTKHSRHRLSVFLLFAALLASCQDRMPTSLEPARPGAVSRAVAPNDDASGVRAAIADVIDRVVPALSDQAEARQLTSALNGLSEAMDNDRAADAAGLALAVGGAVDRYARDHDSDAAELDVIRLALAAVVGG